MKSRFPTQIVLLTVLSSLALAGCLYIYSCRDKVIIELQTITGDANILSNMELNIQCGTIGSSNDQRVWNLDIGISPVPFLENISYEIIANTQSVRGYFDIGFYQQDTGESPPIFVEYDNSRYKLSSPQIKDERESIPVEYYPEGSIAESLYISYSGSDPYYVKMDGIVYFTLPNNLRDVFSYIIQCENTVDNVTTISFEEISNDVEYSVMSGIWAVDEASGTSPENLVPFIITGNSDGPKVCDIYAVEKQSAIVLLTIEDGVDLYATVYYTKTKITNDPVLIFHSDSGQINPIISTENKTCSMGSVIVKIQNDESEWFAVALGKNEINGNIEPSCYDITKIVSQETSYAAFWPEEELAVCGLSEIYESLTHGSYYDFFYRGEEIWISQVLSTDSQISHAYALIPVSPDSLYSSQFAQKIRIMGVKEDTIFFEGLLSIDLSGADIEAQLYYDAYEDLFLAKKSKTITQIEMY